MKIGKWMFFLWYQVKGKKENEIVFGRCEKDFKIENFSLKYLFKKKLKKAEG